MSEKSLDQLINTIKTEAIEAAEKEAQAIVAKAQEDAKTIMDDAEAQKSDIISAAKKQAQQTLNKGKNDLIHAARDIKISLRNELLHLLKNVLQKEIDEHFTPELTEKAILEIIQNIDVGVSLSLPNDLKDNLSAKTMSLLQSQDTALHFDKNRIAKGLIVENKNEGWTYMISPEQITDLLYNQLSPKWVEILKQDTTSWYQEI